MALASHALTTRQRLKDFLDISANDSTTNNVLDRIINASTDWIESYCGRRFLRTTYTNKKYDGNDSQVLLLEDYPVDTTQTLTLSIRTSGKNEDDWEGIDAEDFFVYDDEGILEYPTAKVGAKGRQFIRGAQIYRVTYTAGYYVPQDGNYSEGAANSLPVDLEFACWKICGAAWNERRSSGNIKQERLGQYSVTFAKEAFEDERITDILNKYARQDRVLTRI